MFQHCHLLQVERKDNIKIEAKTTKLAAALHRER